MYLLGFQIEWLNVEEIPCLVNIYDTESGEGVTTFTALEGADDVAHVFVIDNDESKFTPIRAKQMELKFLSTATENLTSFIDSSDNRWLVEYYVNGALKFKGFLVLDDLDEDFLDSDTSNIVTLVATDNIGLLKDEPLTNFDGENPRGEYSLVQYLAWALSKTGLSLPINIVHNLREENNPTKIMYESCHLHSKTFEQEIGESEDCYTVLEKILAHDAFLTQANGEWWIIRMDEMQDSASIVNRFTALGAADGTSTFDLHFIIEPPDMEIETPNFTDRETFVKFQAKVKRARLTYNYDYPKEVVDNIDFERGAPYPEVGLIDPEFAYHIDDWRLFYNLAAPVTTTAVKAYIQRRIVDGYEKERFAVISNGAAGDYFIKSNPLTIGAKDKFYFSVDVRYSADLPGTDTAHFTHFAAQIRLTGIDGTFWTLHGGLSAASESNPKWVQTNASFQGTPQYIWQEGRLADNQTEWQTCGCEAPPAPVEGEIVILLIHAAELDKNRHFQNLRLDISPYINGSYQKYRGQYNEVSQAVNTKKVYDEDVSISDAPRKLMKGALLRFSGTNLYTGTTTFSQIGAAAVISIPGGDRRALFNDRVRIAGTASNNKTFTIMQNLYNAVDNITVLIVQESVTNETVSATFQRAAYSLAGRFYDGLQFGATVPDAANLHPFGYHQIYSVWNQNNRDFRVIDFKKQGMNGAGLMPDIIHRWTINEEHPHTTNKWFALLHFDMDMAECETKGLLAEVFDTTIPKDYASPLTFKYVSDR